MMFSVSGCDEIAKIGGDDLGDVDYPNRDQINQYRSSYTYEGKKDLIIDLMQGSVTFAYDYRGTGTFNAELYDGQGNILLTIAKNVQGPARNTIGFTAPITAGYTIKVSGDGEWRIEHR